MTRHQVATAAIYVLLFAVAAAAAVLSFAALRELAVQCRFDERFAWLLPVTVDAGAGAASIVWLRPGWAPAAAGYARALALVLLTGSVAGNALSHGLEAYGQAPHWLVVVAVSAIAPAVLGALVHLVVLVARGGGSPPAEVAAVELAEDDQLDQVRALLAKGAGRGTVAETLQVKPAKARTLIDQVRAETNGAVR